MYNVTFEGIKIFDISSGFGYGYDGLTSTGGRLEYILKYTPAPFTGDYKATITIETEPAVVIPPCRYHVYHPRIYNGHGSGDSIPGEQWAGPSW